MEIWKTIEGFENYSVSTYGRVRKTKTKKIMHQQINNGYLYIRLNKDNKRVPLRVHRLVAQAFIPNPDNCPCVNHKDENKTNNCVENLEWCTHKYNLNYGTIRERIASAQPNRVSYVIDGIHFVSLIKAAAYINCDRKMLHYKLKQGESTYKGHTISYA